MQLKTIQLLLPSFRVGKCLVVWLSFLSLARRRCCRRFNCWCWLVVVCVCPLWIGRVQASEWRTWGGSLLIVAGIAAVTIILLTIVRPYARCRCRCLSSMWSSQSCCGFVFFVVMGKQSFSTLYADLFQPASISNDVQHKSLLTPLILRYRILGETRDKQYC